MCVHVYTHKLYIPYTYYGYHILYTYTVGIVYIYICIYKARIVNPNILGTVDNSSKLGIILKRLQSKCFVK